MKPFKIKVLLTYVFYVMRNMHAHQNGVLAKIPFLSVTIDLYQKRVASRVIIRLL